MRNKVPIILASWALTRGVEEPRRAAGRYWIVGSMVGRARKDPGGDGEGWGGFLLFLHGIDSRDRSYV